MFKTTAAALLAAGVGPVAAKEFVIQEGTTATMVMGVGKLLQPTDTHMCA